VSGFVLWHRSTISAAAVAVSANGGSPDAQEGPQDPVAAPESDPEPKKAVAGRPIQGAQARAAMRDEGWRALGAVVATFSDEVMEAINWDQQDRRATTLVSLAFPDQPGERRVVVGSVARREDRKHNHVEVLDASSDLVSVDRSDLFGWIAERPASERTENGMPEAVIVQRVELCRDPPPGVARFERCAVPQILGSGTKLEEREHLLIRQPSITHVGGCPILGPTDTDARPILVQVHRAIVRREKPRHLREVAICSDVVLVRVNAEMTICAPEHVLFLRDRAFDIGAARHVGIGHVEHGETDTVSRGHAMGDLPPVTRMHLHLAK
jgi:hypothetical protein